MSYSTSSPPVMVSQAINGPRTWLYREASITAGAADASGYITNGGALGMKVGDVVLVQDTATPYVISSHTVVTVSSTHPGAVDLSNGVTVGGGSNSD
jgi:hypothetical protein